jgi:hypothetical protein
MDDGSAHLSDKSRRKYIVIIQDAQRRKFWFLPFLLSLLGMMEFVCALMPIATPFVRPIRTLKITAGSIGKTRKIFFSDVVRRSLDWFCRTLQGWNGAFSALQSPEWSSIKASYRMDYSPSFGAGFWSPDTLSYGLLKFEERECQFCLANSLTPSSTRGELLTVMTTLETVGNSIRGGAAIFIVDALNIEKGMIKLKSSCPEVDLLLQTISSLIISFECYIIFQAIPRHQNREADALCRGWSNSFLSLVRSGSKLGSAFSSVSPSKMSWPEARFWPNRQPFYWRAR